MILLIDTLLKKWLISKKVELNKKTAIKESTLLMAASKESTQNDCSLASAIFNLYKFARLIIIEMQKLRYMLLSPTFHHIYLLTALLDSYNDFLKILY